MKFGHLELTVKDTAAARRFYEVALGGELVSDQGEFVWYRLGSLEVLLRPGEPPAERARYALAPIGIVLYTDDLPDAVEGLRGHGVDVSPLENEPGCYSFRDPDGHWFQLVDPSDFGG